MHGARKGQKPVKAFVKAKRRIPQATYFPGRTPCRQTRFVAAAEATRPRLRRATARPPPCHRMPPCTRTAVTVAGTEALSARYRGSAPRGQEAPRRLGLVRVASAANTYPLLSAQTLRLVGYDPRRNSTTAYQPYPPRCRATWRSEARNDRTGIGLLVSQHGRCAWSRRLRVGV
jgi:hypothetical protein